MQVVERMLQGFFAGDVGRVLALRPDARIGQQVLDQALHPAGPVHREGDELVGVGVQLSLVAPGEKLRVAGHHPQRLLQVVRSDVGELSQFLVRAVQLLHLLQKMRFGFLRTVMSRMAAVTRMPSALSSGLSMISMGNSLPSLRRADELDARADLLRQRVFGGAQAVGDQPLRKAFRNDVLDLLAQQFVAAVAELLLGLNVEQHDLAGLVDHHHRIRRRLQQAAVAALHLRQMLLRRLAHADVADRRRDQDASALSSGLSMISIGNSLPSLRRPRARCRCRSAGPARLPPSVVPSAISRSAKPSGMMFVTFWPSSSSRR